MSELEDLRTRVAALEAEKRDALELAFRFAQIDGEHHKMWVIDQMVSALTRDGYDAWVQDYESADEGEVYDWDVGVAP